MTNKRGKLRCKWFGHRWAIYTLWDDYYNKPIIQYGYCKRCGVRT